MKDHELAEVRTELGFTDMPWDRPFTDEQLALIAVPTLVAFGAETVVNDVERAADRARRRIRSVEVEIYPGVGHDLLWANPEQIIPRYLSFVGNHDQIHA
ncbi:alpha/beta fold hydrolase [Nocardia rhamnosiphila]|uniref:alpha/beta fold hydrolase n=1 Tax=Nocardia rhamnosiphila TaxID=426716 RepID=UPI000A5B4679|nr:alpha/beta hydrolase [Nocardia rhamnosiphila]